MPNRIAVLFLQSQSFLGADSTLHALLMRHLDRSAVDVHVALTTEPASNPAASAPLAIASIPDLHIRPTYFGPSIHGAGGVARLKRSAALTRLGPSLAGLAAHIRHNQIRVIHGTEKPRDALYGVLLGKLTGARSVIHMHVGYGEWMSRATKWALSNANGVLAISDFVAGSLVNAGIPRQRIHVVPNALDLASWDPSIDGVPVRRELGIASDAPVVGIISRLFRYKGHQYLVEALPLVKREVPGVRLVIVGEDDPRAAWEREGPFSEVLKQQAVRLGVAENVIFTGFRTDIPQLLAAFDAFAHPSWEEPFGMVFLEAMAMRKPVVAWNSGGAPEVIVDGETGYLPERESVDGLAVALTQLLRNPDLRHRLGNAGRERVVRYFTAPIMAQQVLEVYRDLQHCRKRT